VSLYDNFSVYISALISYLDTAPLTISSYKKLKLSVSPIRPGKYPFLSIFASVPISTTRFEKDSLLKVCKPNAEYDEKSIYQISLSYCKRYEN